MTNNIFSNAPDYLTCRFCKAKMYGSHLNLPDTVPAMAFSPDPLIQYSCLNHKPLSMEYTLIRISNDLDESHSTWIPHRIFINHSDSFRLFWSCSFREKVFYLQEHQGAAQNEQVEGWYIFNSTSFPFDWVLEQSHERILSILEMYRTFS